MARMRARLEICGLCGEGRQIVGNIDTGKIERVVLPTGCQYHDRPVCLLEASASIDFTRPFDQGPITGSVAQTLPPLKFR